MLCHIIKTCPDLCCNWSLPEAYAGLSRPGQRQYSPSCALFLPPLELHELDRLFTSMTIFKNDCASVICC